MCNNISNMRAIPQKRTSIIARKKISQQIWCLYIYGVCFLAILHFWRRKFDCDPEVTLPLKSCSEVSNMFTRLDFVQNRLNMKWLRKLYSLLGLLNIYICSSWLLAFNRAFMYEENDYYIHKTGWLSSFLFLFLPHFSIHSPLKAREKCNENGQNQHSYFLQFSN